MIFYSPIAHFLISSSSCLISKLPTLKTISILLFSPFRCQRFLWSTHFASYIIYDWLLLAAAPLRSHFPFYSGEEKPHRFICVKVYVRYSCLCTLRQVLIIFMSISPFSLASLVLGSLWWCMIANCMWTFYRSWPYIWISVVCAHEWLQYSLQVQF